MNPQHTYTNSGTYPVVHQVTTQSPSGQMYIQECKKNVQANCGSSVQVQERIECCELVFYLDACNSSNNGCTDYWEIVNTQGVVCLTSNDVSPVFHLRNIDTYLHPLLFIRHWWSCNGVVTGYTNTPYTIQHSGIFANPIPGSDDLYTQIGLNSALNNYSQLFPTPAVSSKNVYMAGVLNVNETLPVHFTNDEICMGPDAGLNIKKSVFIEDNSDVYNGCTTAWRGLEVKSNAKLQINNSRVRGAVYAVRPLISANVNLSNCDFYNNFICVFANNYFIPSFINNTFGAGNSLPALGGTSISEVIGETGAYSTEKGFAGWFFRDAVLQNGGYLVNNTFNDLANGVYMVNSTANLDEVFVANTVFTAGYSADHTGHGIYMRHDAGLGTLYLSNCYFDHADYGMRIISGKSGTNFSLSGTNTIGHDQFGIMLEQRNNGKFTLAKVINTTIDSYQAGLGFIYTGTGGASSVTLSNNTITVRGGDGILLKGANPGSGNIRVFNNTISTEFGAVRSGIHLQDFQGALIAEDASGIGNHITLESNYSGSCYGIWLQNSSGSVIRNNKVEGSPWSVTGYGFVLDNSVNNTIEGNTAEKLEVGFKFTGNCKADGMFRCNVMVNTGYGIQLGESWEDPIGFIGLQANTGNAWNDAGFAPGSGLIGAVNYGDLSQLEASLFHTDQAAGSNEYPQSFLLQSGLVPGDWFWAGNHVGCAPDPLAQNPQNRTAVEEIQSQGFFKIFPNPADDAVMLVAENTFEHSDVPFYYNLYSATGMLLIHGSSQVNIPARIETASLAPGVYYCKVGEGTKQVQTLKIVVLH